ncbi:MAG TPA: NHL repeat-containing protein [Polyangia bacterium]|nr:NHL repeat-containing protein [Polyangia bacterium]
MTTTTTTMSSGTSRWIVGALAVALALTGCAAKKRTEIILGLATDVDAPAPLRSVTLQVFNPPTSTVVADEQDLTISGTLDEVYELPGTYGVYSANGGADRVRVLLTASDDHGAKLVERSAVLSLIPEQTLFVRLGVVSACEQMFDCGAGDTCIEGRCQPETIASWRLPPYASGMENQIACDTATTFIDTSTKQPLQVTGTACPNGGTCLEGVCLAADTSDGGAQPGDGGDAGTAQVFSGDGHLTSPQNIYIEPVTGNILVACFTGSVVELDKNGNYLKTFADTGATMLTNGVGVTEDPSGHIFVSDYGANRILEFDNAAANQLTFTVDPTVTVSDPAQIASDAQGNLWIANDGNSQVIELDGTGKLVKQFSTSVTPDGGAGGSLAGTVGLALDQTGNVWIADYYLHALAKFTTAGAFVAQYGTFGTTQALGSLNEPYAVAIDASNRIFVVDTGNADVQVFDTTGNAKSVLAGTAANPLKGPSGVAVDKRGLIYVSDSGNNQIRVFTLPQ